MFFFYRVNKEKKGTLEILVPKDHRQVNSECLQYCAKSKPNSINFANIRDYPTKISEVLFGATF